MKDWDYSVLSHTASIYGGPEKYVETIKKQAYQAAIKAADKSHQAAIKTTDKKWLKRTLPLAPFVALGAFTFIHKITSKTKSYLERTVSTDKEVKATETKSANERPDA